MSENLTKNMEKMSENRIFMKCLRYFKPSFRQLFLEKKILISMHTKVITSHLFFHIFIRYLQQASMNQKSVSHDGDGSKNRYCIRANIEKSKENDFSKPKKN